MKKNSSKTLFFTLFLAVFIVAIAYVFSQNNNKHTVSPQNSSNQNENKSNTQATSAEIKGSIVYISRDSQGSDIYVVNSKAESKKVFTDKDEDTKIKLAQSLTSSGKVLALMAPTDQEFGGALYFIYTDGSGKKEKIIDEFASTQAPIISSNAKKIAYIVFSNAEKDYGFSLYVMNTDASNKQKIASDSTGIKILSWNYDSSQIAFLKGSDPKQNLIYTADLIGSEPKELISFKEKIYFLNWGKNGFVFAKGPSENDDVNKSEIFKMDNNAKNIKRLTNNDSHENFCYFSSDEKNVGYLSIKYDKSVDIAKTGKINSISVEGDNNKELSEGNYLIGWLSQ